MRGGQDALVLHVAVLQSALIRPTFVPSASNYTKNRTSQDENVYVSGNVHLCGRNQILEKFSRFNLYAH